LELNFFVRLFYTDPVGQPTGQAAAFLKWACESKSAAMVIGKVGFIPVPRE